MNLLTFSEARSALWEYGNRTVSFATATSGEKAVFDGKLNQVIERFFSLMKPRQSLRRINVPIYDEHVTLPRYCQSLLGAVTLTSEGYLCNPLLIYSRFHEFAESGAGCCEGKAVLPVTELAQTFRDPVASYVLRATGTAAEGNYTLIGGRDANWNEFHDSVTLAITNGSVDTTRVWNGLPRFHKPVTATPVEIYAVDTVTAVATQIAVHMPGETVPAYQRYHVPGCGSAPAARILTRLAYVKLTADTDIVIPGIFGALKKGLQALNYEDNNDADRAREVWNEALALLDSDKQQFEGEAAIPSIRSLGDWGVGGIPNL